MFKTPTFEEIREAILRDTKSIWPSADVSEDSDHFVHTSRLASCASGQYAHQHWIARQIFPDTADSDYWSGTPLCAVFTDEIRLPPRVKRC